MDDRAPVRRPPSAGPALRWASASSILEDPEAAAAQVSAALREQLGAQPLDFALAFFTAPLAADAATLVRTLRERSSPRCFAGVSASAVVTSQHEIETGPALAVVAGSLPGVTVSPFVLVPSAWGEAMNDPAEFGRHTSGVAGAEIVLLFGDPFTLDVERVLAAFHRHAPGVRVAGGMASAAVRPNGNTLVLNDWQANDGGIGIALSGALRADVVVSQGCRPIGPPLEVTEAEGNVILKLDGQPALERAEQVLRTLSDDEREHLRHGLYLGRPVRGGAAGRGDYLIRNLLGADRDRGAIAVADRVVEREKVRLHVRDANIAAEDLEMLLSPQVVDTRAEAALVFSCNGRGRRFFGGPDRDIGTLQAALGGGVPAAGLFCAGEIGPVGEENCFHGHTASIAILRSRSAS